MWSVPVQIQKYVMFVFLKAEVELSEATFKS